MWKLLIISQRSMRQLACRFCEDAKYIFVVDPELDLRYRFQDKSRLSEMLKARGIMVDIDQVETNYMKWWQAYESLCATISAGRPIAKNKKLLLSLSHGLLDVLKLPNDIECFSHTNCGSEIEQKPLKHSSYLNATGMLKHGTYPPSLDLIGTPVSLSFSLQQTLSTSFAKLAIPVSPPNFVRGAVIEGINIPLEKYLTFTDGATTAPLYLTGHGLPSLTSLFVKRIIPSRSTYWPLRLFSAGCAYSNLLSSSFRHEYSCSSKLDLSTAPQRMKIAALSFCVSKEEAQKENEFMKSFIKDLVNSKLAHDFEFTNLPPKRLNNYESEAATVLYSNLEIARIGLSRDYISRRLNIVSDENKVHSNFVHLVYTEIDITSAIGFIFEKHIAPGASNVAEFIRQFLQ